MRMSNRNRIKKMIKMKKGNNNRIKSSNKSSPLLCIGLRLSASRNNNNKITDSLTSNSINTNLLVNHD